METQNKALKIIYQYDTNGTLVKTHFGEDAAAKFYYEDDDLNAELLDVTTKNIIISCNSNGDKFKGYYWTFRKTTVFKTARKFYTAKLKK